MLQSKAFLFLEYKYFLKIAFLINILVFIRRIVNMSLPVGSNPAQGFNSNNNLPAAAPSEASAISIADPFMESLAPEPANLQALPVVHLFGKSEILKSSVARALMIAMRPQITRNPQGGLEGTILTGQHFIAVDCRLPQNLANEDELQAFAQRLHEEAQRPGSLVPRGADLLVGVVNGDQPEEDVRAEIQALQRLCHSFSSRTPCMILCSTGSPSEVDKLSDRYEASRETPTHVGTFGICAAPRHPLAHHCPRTQNLPLMDRHPVVASEDGFLRVCEPCHQAEVCSGAVEMPQMTSLIQELRNSQPPYGVAFVIYRPCELSKDHPALLALQNACTRTASGAAELKEPAPTLRRFRILKELVTTRRERLMLLPMIVANAVSDLRHNPDANIDREIVKRVGHLFDRPQDAQSHWVSPVLNLPTTARDNSPMLRDETLWSSSPSVQMALLDKDRRCAVLAARSLFCALRLLALPAEAGSADESKAELLPESCIHDIYALIRQRGLQGACKELVIEKQDSQPIKKQKIATPPEQSSDNPQAIKCVFPDGDDFVIPQPLLEMLKRDCQTVKGFFEDLSDATEYPLPVGKEPFLSFLNHLYGPQIKELAPDLVRPAVSLAEMIDLIDLVNHQDCNQLEAWIEDLKAKILALDPSKEEDMVQALALRKGLYRPHPDLKLLQLKAELAAFFGKALQAKPSFDERMNLLQRYQQASINALTLSLNSATLPLIKHLLGLTTLKTLQLTGKDSDQTPESLKMAIIMFLQYLPPKLSELKFEHVDFREGVFRFPQNLGSLEFASCRLPENMELPETLQNLVLIGCPVTVNFLKQIPKELPNLAIIGSPQLRKELLQHLPRNLSSLNAQGCVNLSDADLKELPPGLQILDVRGCAQITDKGIEQLRITKIFK